MPEPGALVPVALRDERERTIAWLSELFSSDKIDVDEFERRVALAHRAGSTAELADVLERLPPVPASAPASHPAALVPADRVRESKTMIAVMGGIDHRGEWQVPRRLRVFAAMGGASLDFREARLPAGVVEVSAVAMMGGIEIIVPPGLAVESDGVAIMGGFEDVNRAPVRPESDAPLLRIRGLAFMGGVEISMRLPGESARDAQRRVREERKARRREAR